MPPYYSSLVVRNSNRLVCIFLLGHEYMMAGSEVALFLGSLVPAGTKMENMAGCQLAPPPVLHPPSLSCPCEATAACLAAVAVHAETV